MLGAVARRRNHSGLRALLAGLLCACILGSLTAPAFAAGGQVGVIQGTITDTDGRPIAGAAISAASLTGSYRATSSAQGTFTIVGVNVDTYAVSVSARGFDAYVLRGATVVGDQTLTLPLALTRVQAVIGRVGAYPATGAFQPTQTVDSYTISGARIGQTTGSPADSNLNDLVLAAPGVSLSNFGIPTIRGGSQREVGYQLDGVTYTDPVRGQNGSLGLYSGLNSVQVVEGGGDASQGGLGSGVINVIPKRGTYPGTADLTAQIGGPNFDNFFGGEYGFATPSGSISNYITMTNDRFAPYYGFHAQSAAAYGNFFGDSLRSNTQFSDNFVLKFGQEKSQSLQVLYENVSQLRYQNLGGLPPGGFPANPLALPYYLFDPQALGQPLLPFVQPLPGTPTTNIAPTTAELGDQTQTRFLKIEYDNSFNASTYLALRYYNWEQLENTHNLYQIGPNNQGVATYEDEGGPVVGTSFDLTHTFSDKLIVTLNGQYTVTHPILNLEVPFFSVAAGSVGDFITPTGGCPAGGPGTVPFGSGYVNCSPGGASVLEPDVGLSYNNTWFQQYGIGLRFQYAFSDRLHADFGARYEGQNQQWQNPYNPGNVINPFDVPPSLWTANIITPKAVSPRAALSFQIDRDDAVRVSYGRSVVFQTAQTVGTPTGLVGNLAYLASLPPDLIGVTPLVVGAPLANQCGTALNGVAGTFPCANYLQQFYWSADRLLDAVGDAGGTQPAIYNNYDASYSHQFGPNGFALKVTPFYKLGTNLPSATLFATLEGGTQVFSESSRAFNRTTGVEFQVTTPQRPYGFAGFLSGSYQNVLQSAPPLSNGDFNGVPQLSPATLALGDVYRAGYVSPASIRIGGTYTFKNGFSITPIVQIDSGYPYNEGDTIAAGGPGNPNIGFGCPASAPIANYPQVNFGCGIPILRGYQNSGGASLNTNYADPAYSGSQLNPNVAATRGTPTSSNSGGVTWSPNVEFNLTLQYKHGRDTIGIQMVNLLTNGYNGTTPAVNPFYQPVGNGTSGPQTGQNSCLGQFGASRGCSALPVNTYAFTNGAYLLTNGNVGFWQLAPLAPTSFNLFYRRQL